MKERPILFSGPMIRVILDGTKTQTRRVLKPQPVSSQLWGYGIPNSLPTHFCVHARWKEPYPSQLKQFGPGDPWLPCPYGKPGERLWCRETFCLKEGTFGDNGTADCWYKADSPDVRAVDGDGWQKWRKDGREASPWTPSIHMPRWASRITLEICSVRVEKLQDITKENALAEGAPNGWLKVPAGEILVDTRAEFAILWDSINGKKPGYSWDSNPWVWVIEFRRVTP